MSNTPWMDIASAETGVKEISGSKDTPRIVEYHRATSLKATDDETPWCAAFVSWVLMKAGYASKYSARARSYLDYGTPALKPQFGDIVIFSRGSAGHVAFYVGHDANGNIQCLGGNQGNKVCVSTYDKERILGFRRPYKV